MAIAEHDLGLSINEREQIIRERATRVLEEPEAVAKRWAVGCIQRYKQFAEGSGLMEHVNYVVINENLHDDPQTAAFHKSVNALFLKQFNATPESLEEQFATSPKVVIDTLGSAALTATIQRDQDGTASAIWYIAERL